MALRRDPSWLCGGQRQMEGITSRESDVQEPRAKRADRGRQDSHGAAKGGREKHCFIKTHSANQGGRSWPPRSDPPPSNKPSFFRGHAEHSNTARRRCVVVVVL
jgi:hypothetical protein